MNRPVSTLIVSICSSKLYFLNGWFVLLASSGVIGLGGDGESCYHTIFVVGLSTGRDMVVNCSRREDASGEQK
jgi:hypothetical protein